MNTLIVLPSYFVLLDIYYGLVESRIISSDFSKSRLLFLGKGQCFVVARAGANSYCQLAKKSIRRDIYFIGNSRKITHKEFDAWSKNETQNIEAHYVSKTGNKSPVPLTKIIKQDNVSNAYLEGEDLYNYWH